MFTYYIFGCLTPCEVRVYDSVWMSVFPFFFNSYTIEFEKKKVVKEKNKVEHPIKRFVRLQDKESIII